MYMYVREKMKAYVCMLKECACIYHVHVHVMLSTKLVRPHPDPQVGTTRSVHRQYFLSI